MKQKILRYSGGFLMLGLILASFYISKMMLFIVSIFFILIAIQEYRQMFKSNNISIHPVLPELIGIFCCYNFINSNDPSGQYLVTPILVFGIVFSFILTVLRNKKPYVYTTLATISAFLLTFCGLYITKLTYYYESINSFYFICVYFLAVLSGDWIASKIGPYSKGKKLAIEISPDKTIAGSISHLLFSCLSCLFLIKFLDYTPLKCILLGIIISVFAQFGDLSISLIKRELKLKHSGTLFLNYGGIIDRMDAFIFSAPAVYYFLFISNII